MHMHNCRLDIYKLVMTVICAMMHFEGHFFPKDRLVFAGGYLVVDFFFVLDGFLLYQSYKSGKYSDSIDFTWKRFKRFFPYAVTLVLAFVVMAFCHDVIAGEYGLRESIKWIVITGMNEIAELLFLQMFIPTAWINFVTWYISVLLIVGFVLYEYLRCKKNKYSWMMPVVFLAIIKYLIAVYGHLDVHYDNIPNIMQGAGVFRGIAGMCIGVFGAEIVDEIHIEGRDKRKGLTLLEVFIFAFIFMDMFVFPHSKYDAIFVVACALLIPLTFYNGSTNKYNRIFNIINKLTFSMFFLQNFVRQIWLYIREQHENITKYGFGMTMLLYLVTLVALSSALIYVVQLEKKLVLKIKSDRE